MKVSMHIVHKWLKNYSPEAHILKGEQEIIGVRYFTDDTSPKKEFLYIGHNRDFIETDRRGVICANSGDIILLNTEDIYGVFNEMQEMLEFYNEWEMQIMRLIEENVSVSEILEATLPVLGHGLVLTDASHFMLGEAQISDSARTYRLPGGRLSDETITFINKILSEHITDRRPFPGPREDEVDLVRNFFDGDSVIGWIVVLDTMHEEDMDSLVQLTESFCRLLEFWFRINRDSLRLSNQSGVFSDILEGKESDPAVIRSRLNGIGWIGEPVMQLANIYFSEENLFNRTYLIRTIPATFAGSYAFRYRDDLLLVMNLSYGQNRPAADDKEGSDRKISGGSGKPDLLEMEQAERKTTGGSGKPDLSERAARPGLTGIADDAIPALQELARRYQASVGLSYPFRDVRNLGAYYEQTNIALQFGGRKSGEVYTCAEHAMPYLRSVIRKNLITDISHPALDILSEYDAKKGTDYYNTLGSYLLMDRDQTRAAERLHIHRNSLIYRINKIRELLGIDLDNDKERFYILMSYFIREKDFGT